MPFKVSIRLLAFFSVRVSQLGSLGCASLTVLAMFFHGGGGGKKVGIFLGRHSSAGNEDSRLSIRPLLKMTLTKTLFL